MRFWRLASIILALAMLPLVPGGNAHAAETDPTVVGCALVVAIS